MLGYKQMAWAASALAILASGAGGPKSALTAGAVLNATATAAPRRRLLPRWRAGCRSGWLLPNRYCHDGENLCPVYRGRRTYRPDRAGPGRAPERLYDGAWAEELVSLSSSSEVNPAAVGSVGQLYPYTVDRLYPCAGSGCPQSSSSYSNLFDFYPNEIVWQLFFRSPAAALFAPRDSRRDLRGPALRQHFWHGHVGGDCRRSRRALDFRCIP